MKFEIVELEDFSGPQASIYSIRVNNEDETLFEKFLNENKDTFENEVFDILQRLDLIGYEHGARRRYFKENEGNLGDLICALYDNPVANLRLYCIRMGSAVIILGGGGYKPKTIRALQEDAKLTQENYLLREISKLLGAKMKEGEIYWINDYELGGNLIIDTDE
jgi:hypothetical protein